MPKQLPPNPDLEYLKKEAKDLRRAQKRGDAAALRLIGEQHPRLQGQSAPSIVAADFSLQDARLVVARDYRFESWPRLVAEIESMPLKRELEQAIEDDEIARVEKLVGEHPDLLRANVRNRNWGPPLSHAANLGKLDLVKALVHLAPEGMEHAFNRAALKGHTEVARFLMAEKPALGEDVHYGCFGPCEALEPGGVRFMLELGADPNAVWENGGTPLDMALCTYSHRGRHDCVEALVQGGVDYEDGPEMDLHRGRLDLLAQRLDADPSLLQRHSNFRQGKEYGGVYGGAPLISPTLLHICAEYGEVDAVRELLGRGVEVNARCRPDAAGVGDQTPLFHAVTSRHHRAFAVLELLVEAGADINARATVRVPSAGIHSVLPDDPLLRQVTPLGYALGYPNQDEANAEVVEFLRQRGAVE